MTRLVVPEILDDLDPADPRARASRRDLARINALMAQGAIAAGLLRRTVRGSSPRLLEIGAGDGAFSLGVARRLARGGLHGEIVLLDRLEAADSSLLAGFEAIGWRARRVTADAFAWLDGEGRDFGADAVCANLFLHHFEEPMLRRLLRACRRAAPVFACTEPSRDRFSLVSSRLVGLIGANDVTRHDAPASVRAGFRPGELSALWPVSGEVVEDRRRGPFTLAFAARRESAA